MIVNESSRAASYQGSVRLAVVLSGWPRLSETFALNELLALRAAGMLAAVFATKPGPAGPRQPGVEQLEPLVEVLPEGNAAEQGEYIARRLEATGVSGVHGYFAHQPAAVAREAAARLGVPYGFSAHALDVRKVSPAELGRLAAGAAAVIACNADVAQTLTLAGAQPALLPHGVDTCLFHPARAATGPGTALLAVGRCVEKKGFEVLIRAMAHVDSSVHLRIVGDGPLREGLEQEAVRLGAAGRVEFLGRLTHDQLVTRYSECDIVVVPSIVDRNGDRDGLPNVVLEAMASGRAVVASDVAAISSAVRDGITGILIPPNDPRALAAALRRLIDDEPARAKMGAAARQDALRDFDLHRCSDEFCRVIGRCYA